MDRAVFLDTGYAIALLSPRDTYHEAAKRLGAEIKRGAHKIVTTDAVVLEIGAALARVAHRAAACTLIEALRNDPAVEIVPLDRPLFDAAFRLFKERPDKDWSLTDCVSFTLMQMTGLREALTADDHYGQAGLEALLLKG